MTYTYTKVCYKVCYKVVDVDVSSIAGNVDVIAIAITLSTFPAMLEMFPALLESSTSIVDVDVPALLEDSTGPPIKFGGSFESRACPMPEKLLYMITFSINIQSTKPRMLTVYM
jgi:hypothetical protein